MEGGSETSKVEQVGTEQATIVVWGSVLLRSQNGHRMCLMSSQVLGREVLHYLLGSPWWEAACCGRH